jgi:hypothetical protein
MEGRMMSLEERKAEKPKERELLKRLQATTPRPNCAQCGKRLPPFRYAYLDCYRTKGAVWGYYGNNVFCTAGCGLQFGLAAYRAGHWIKK